MRRRRPRRWWRRLAGTTVLIVALGLACAAAFIGVLVLADRASDDEATTGGTRAPSAPGETAPSEGPAAEPAPEPARPSVECPPGATGCRAHTGRVIFVESVDPDGDGDLHLVVTGGSVTAPGITVLDVRPDLRPAEDPRIGDVVSGAGPVFRGSFGQAQIQVDEFRVVRRR